MKLSNVNYSSFEDNVRFATNKDFVCCELCCYSRGEDECGLILSMELDTPNRYIHCKKFKPAIDLVC